MVTREEEEEEEADKRTILGIPTEDLIIIIIIIIIVFMMFFVLLSPWRGAPADAVPGGDGCSSCFAINVPWRPVAALGAVAHTPPAPCLFRNMFTVAESRFPGRYDASGGN